MVLLRLASVAWLLIIGLWLVGAEVTPQAWAVAGASIVLFISRTLGRWLLGKGKK